MTSATERLLAFSFANADVLLEVDERHVIRYGCGAIRNLLNRADKDLPNLPVGELIQPADRSMAEASLRVLANNSRLNPVLVHLAGGGERQAPAMLGGYRLDSDAKRYYLTLSRPRQGSIETLPQAGQDAETGLLDRESFTQSVERRLAAHPGQPVDSKLTLIRIEELGAIKDRVGGDAMAKMMEEIGGLLRAMSIDGNTAGRLGEDRFGVMHMPTIDPAELEQGVVEISRHNDPTGAGVSVAGATVDLAEDDLSDADRRRVMLYTVRKFSDSKDADTVGTLAEGMKEILSDTVKRVQNFKQTLTNSRLRIALQPVVHLSDRRVHHYEALSRPTDGQAPAGLVGFAEEIGMSPDFDLLVCQKVIDILNDAQDSGAKPSIAVNLSAVSLDSKVFVKTFRTLMSQFSWAVERLQIEVTESMRIRDLAATNEVLQAFRADGHKVCLDDFGAGAASFPYIQALEVDYVKIDGAYVQRMETHPRDHAILKAMVGLCRDLGIGTVAEMVETEAQAAILAELGVDFAQGYLFGQPSVDFSFGTPAGAAAPSDNPRNDNKVRMLLRRRGAVETWG